MAPRPVTAPKPAPKGGAKIGGLPLWIVGLGVVAAIGIGLYFRHKASTQPAGAATPAATDSSGVGGAAAGPTDLTPVSDLATAINGLTGLLGAGGGISASSGGDGSAAAASAPTAAASPSSTPTYTAPPSSPVGTALQGPYLTSTAPVYADPSGNLFTIGPSGAAQPAYPYGPPGSYASPFTYAGLGVTPAAISSSEVAPPVIPTPPHITATNVQPTPAPRAALPYSQTKAFK